MSFVNSPQVKYAVDGKPRERLGCGSQVTRGLTIFLILIVVGLVGYSWLGTNLSSRLVRRDGAIRGMVVNAQRQPLAQARVFLVAAPERETYTLADGSFVFDAIPSGAHVLIVVLNEIGQEFPVTILSGTVTDVGALAYVAPPDK